MKGRRLPPGYIEYKKHKAAEKAFESRRKFVKRVNPDDLILGFIYLDTD